MRRGTCSEMAKRVQNEMLERGCRVRGDVPPNTAGTTGQRKLPVTDYIQGQQRIHRTCGGNEGISAGI